jgi:chemotaxis protein MotB
MSHALSSHGARAARRGGGSSPAALSALALTPLCALVALAALGCGYTEQEWRVQLDKSARLETDLRAANAKADRAQKLSDDEKARAAKLAAALEAAGIDPEEIARAKDLAALERIAAGNEEQRRAIEEYQAREALVEREVALADKVKRALGDKAKGVIIGLRDDMLALSLPEEKLFAGQGEVLSKEGRELLKTLAGVLADDPLLAVRNWRVHSLVAGAGTHPQLMGVAVGRGRNVALFMTDEKTSKLPPNRWTVAGQVVEHGKKPEPKAPKGAKDPYAKEPRPTFKPRVDLVSK